MSQNYSLTGSSFGLPLDGLSSAGDGYEPEITSPMIFLILLR